MKKQMIANQMNELNPSELAEIHGGGVITGALKVVVSAYMGSLVVAYNVGYAHGKADCEEQ